MKVHIARNWYKSRFVPRTKPEHPSLQHGWVKAIKDGPGAAWVNKMRQLSGIWVAVDTEYIWGNQFQLYRHDIRVHIDDIDGIDFEPEYKGVDDYFNRAIKQKAFTGVGLENTQELRHYMKGLIKFGQIKVG